MPPGRERFGRISIRSAYRTPEVNRVGNKRDHNCARNESAFANHIWDRRDGHGRMGAMATIVVHAAIPSYEAFGRWEPLAWWMHDHLPYSAIQFFPRFAAFNLGWREEPERTIYSYIPPRRGLLTKPGMANHSGLHEAEYGEFLATLDEG